MLNNEQSQRESVFSVSQLNRVVADTLESVIPLVWVKGEISNFTVASSGHWYFTLKDKQASVRAVMFRGRAGLLDFLPKVGDQYELRAKVTLYEPRGDYQLQIETIRRVGLGNLYDAFLKLKDKLLQLGWLDESQKRRLPSFPKRIGVISSLQAAALQDVLTALGRRVPHIPIIIYPSLVQGESAAKALSDAVALANQRAEVDVLLLVRGGGSIEDLWSFNEEILATAIYQSGIPIVSGVGHETDFTIADLVADLRAPTPTAAAELVSLTKEHYEHVCQSLHERLQEQVRWRLDRLWQNLDRLSLRLVSPEQRLQHQHQKLQLIALRLSQSLPLLLRVKQQRLTILQSRLSQRSPNISFLEQKTQRMTQQLMQKYKLLHRERVSRLVFLEAKLRAFNPEHILQRGYAVIRDQNGNLVKTNKAVQLEDILDVQLARGRLRVQVVD